MGGSGRRLLGKFPGVFETEVAGRRGPFGSCQGVLLSQNRTVLQQTLRSARFPPSAPDFLIRPGAIGWAEEGDRERCGRVLGKGTRRGSRLGRLPLPHRSASFDFWPLLPGRGRPGKASTNLRDPGAHLIPAHLRARPSRAGAGRAGPCFSRIRPGLLPRARLGQIQGFLLTAPASPQVSPCRVPISCCPRATPRAGLHPPPPCAFPPPPLHPPQEPKCLRDGVSSWTRLPVVLRWGQVERPGCDLRPHPTRVGKRFPRSPRS